MKRFITFMLAVIAVAAMSSTSAQIVEKKTPLYMSVGMTGSMNFSDKMTAGYNINLDYTFAKRYSVHAIAETTMFIPEEGTISDFNQATNLGGGVGYTFLRADNETPADMLIRAAVTHTVGGSPYKNTNYKVGIHLNEYSVKGATVTLTYGLGYSLTDFSSKGMKTDHGMYVTLGLRF